VEEEVLQRMDSAAERASAAIQADLDKKKELQEALKKAEEEGDDEEMARLIGELANADEAISKKIDAESADQAKKLADRLAQRKNRRKKNADKELEVKQQ
jgi:hypothetical protein